MARPIVPKSADAIVDKSVIRVGVATIMASLCLQCLDVCVDRHLDMKKQVLQNISACSFKLAVLIKMKSTKTTKSYMKYVHYYIIGQTLLLYQAGARYHFISQEIITLLGSKFISVSGEFITLLGVFITL